MGKTLLILLSVINCAAVYAQQEMTKPFQDCGIEGSITIYNYAAKQWTFSDINDSQIPSLPASTFKIINTLIALESGVIADEHEIIQWPGSIDTVKYAYRPDTYRHQKL